MHIAIHFAVAATILLSGAAFTGELNRRTGKNGGVRPERRVEESRARQPGDAERNRNRHPGHGYSHIGHFHGNPHHDHEARHALKMYFEYVATPEENARIAALRADHSKLSLWVPGY